ncbi:MAG: hypothetical protein SFY95_02580 [Planctomycetota bacterium]|nr:hypothetical protein [Planctomycetota bacterium]
MSTKIRHCPRAWLRVLVLAAPALLAGCEHLSRAQIGDGASAPGSRIAQGGAWEVVLPGPEAAGSYAWAGLESGRRDSELGIASANPYPLDFWPAAPVPSVERPGYINIGNRAAGSYVFFRSERRVEYRNVEVRGPLPRW